MDEADVVAYTTLTDQYLKRFGNFVENHFCALVRSISDECYHGNSSSSVSGGDGTASLGSSGEFPSAPSVVDGSIGTNGVTPLSNVTLHTCGRHIWDSLHHPIRIHWSPTSESASLEELTCIPHPLDGNPDVQKVMLVLVTITSQARSLREKGENCFVNAIVLYGDYNSLEGEGNGAAVGQRTGGGDPQRKDYMSSSGTFSLAEIEGEGHVTISKLLPVLLDLLEYIQACSDFVNHWMSQIAALFKETKPHVVSITNLQLYTVFREFSDLLAFLAILDEIIQNQTVLQEHWHKYRQMIKSVRADSRSFDTDPANLLQLERQLVQIDKYIMSAHIFRNFIDAVLQQNQRLLTRNLLLADKFLFFVTTLAADLEKPDTMINDTNQEIRPISLAAMYVFAASLFPTCFDQKKVFHKTVWEPLKRIQAVTIPGANVWIPEVFLSSCTQGNNGSKLFDNRTMQSLATARQTSLQQKVTSLPKDILQWNLQYTSWTIRLQEVLYLKDLSTINMADLSRKCNLLVEGTKLAQTLSQTFKLILNLHASLQRPISRHVVVQLCQILELLKSIEGTFFQFSVRLSCSTMYIVQYVMHTALSQVRSAQRAIISSVNDVSNRGRVDESRADALSVLKILEHCLRGTLSNKRLLVARIALDWAMSSNTYSRLWRDEESSLILPAAFERISQLINLETKLERYCDGSVVYFHRVILSTYFSNLYSRPHESSKLPMIFLIVRDCLKYLHNSSYSTESRMEELAENCFLSEIEGYLKTHFVERLCQDVETDLRILSHTHLQVDASGSGIGDKSVSQNSSSTTPAPPFRSGVKSLEGILETQPFCWNNRTNLSLKNVVEHYLSKTYYNLASVALHDWQSYATMRVLALDKYKLNILDDHLPGHSLEQGRDILEIVRNLPQFVSEFTYNLNNQVFVQINSPNKHLDTVNIRHLANSLRTHGPGMANTTINFTYRFLRAKINALSQFLYIEQVKSRLSKDIKLFKQSNQQEIRSPTATSSSSMDQKVAYASLLFERANKLKQNIRKLGVTPEGLSPLDQFRILITHIGNALGFVRLVRSGGSHYLAGGYQFVPDLQDLTQFSELIDSTVESTQMSSPSSCSTSDHTWSDDIKQACTGIDSAIKTLSSSFSDGVDYFKLLVNAFQPALLEPTNSHLRNFYGIIPALTLSYVDHMRLSKEKLAKRSKSPSIFTDDGFPMGVAYLLKVLDQGADFDSLSWFSNVEFYLLRERRAALQAIQDSKKDEKLQQANTLTAKRVLDVLNEFQLVRYNLSSARIFFQHDILSSSSPNHSTNVSRSDA